MGKEIPRYAVVIVHTLVDREDREEILGDLAERYHAKKSQEGEKAAKRRLRYDLTASVMPFLLIKLYKLTQALIVLWKALNLIQKQD